MRLLRATAIPWAAAAILPLPALVAIDPAKGADVACLYLGLATAWWVTELYPHDGYPDSSRAWRAKALASAIGAAAHVALFVLFGLAAGVQTHLPFPLMATLSAIPAVGLVPWLLGRLRQPYTTIFLAAVLVLAAKLAACVVARLVYGPDYLAQGYASADWRTAKLMIALFWALTTALSLSLFVADYLAHKSPPRAPAPA
jgi:hypothetical protein